MLAGTCAHNPVATGSAWSFLIQSIEGRRNLMFKLLLGSLHLSDYSFVALYLGWGSKTEKRILLPLLACKQLCKAGSIGVISFKRLETMTI
mmetsp:Transcript_49310/g.102863  ORF Transcript_49310/g.102863 Transcript_49310/m.102863 type:complete len:91 (+) Transcript_49310:34-306(+)